MESITISLTADEKTATKKVAHSLETSVSLYIRGLLARDRAERKRLADKRAANGGKP